MANDIIDSAEALERFVSGPAAAVWFGSESCGVCRVLRPKLIDMVAHRFPRLAVGTVDCGANPELAAQHAVFTLPVLVIYFDGREWLRRSRAFSLEEVASAIERPYSMLFSE